MRSCILVVVLIILCHQSLFAQKEPVDRVMRAFPSFVMPIKHHHVDSFFHVYPRLIYVSRHLKNQHVDNPAVRYALDNLKKERIKYYELAKAINTLTDYAENERIRDMIEYVKMYFQTIQEKENAINQLQDRVTRDSIQYYKEHPGQDSIHEDVFLNPNLNALLTFMAQDANYRWLKEKSRDSLSITLLSASNKPYNLWLNNGKAKYYRFKTENLLGDTIGCWIKVLPYGSQLKFFLDENVYQRKKYVPTQAIDDICLLEIPDSIYFSLNKMHIGELKRRYWNYYSDMTFSFGQGFISTNWASGGESSLSILSDLQYFIMYKKDNISWENSSRYRLGALKNGSEDLSKNEDKLELQSKIGVKAYRHWNYATQFDMNTVLFKTHDNGNRDKIIASFLSPGNFTVSLGMDYKPRNNISLYLSPIAGQWVYIRDTNRVDPARYGLEKGEKCKSDAGAKVELKNTLEFFNFLKIDNHLILFSSYYETPEMLTVDWRLSFNFKINYFMQTSVYANMVYNQNDSKKIQMKETLNLGVHFRF